MRHRLAVVLALTACAVLAGATSLLAVGEWIADAPVHVLKQVGAHPDPLLPRRVLPAETTVRRLLARVDGDALDRAARSGRGRQESSRRGQGERPEDPSARGPDRLRPAVREPAPDRSHWSTPSALSSPSWTSAGRPTRSRASSRCWTPSPTWPASWSPATRCTPSANTPAP
ncbi:transposase family protein [Streptomyces sp. NPDC008125]|uniref:transposase family protein n=1 Tax=Streptomyces sp. NPDC008125 TaxID=3364811 RepID=UPI0036E0F3FF